MSCTGINALFERKANNDKPDLFVGTHTPALVVSKLSHTTGGNKNLTHCQVDAFGEEDIFLSSFITCGNPMLLNAPTEIEKLTLMRIHCIAILWQASTKKNGRVVGVVWERMMKNWQNLAKEVVHRQV